MQRVCARLHRWIEAVVPTSYALLVAAVAIGKYARRRAVWQHRGHFRLPLGAGPGTEGPSEHARPMAATKHALSWVAALIHAWALLDRIGDPRASQWWLVKPASHLLAWVSRRHAGLCMCRKASLGWVG
jgi:hypothetical protein